MVFNHKQKVLAVLLGALCSTADAQLVLAEVDEDLALLYGNEEMISIATGAKKPLHLAPSVASVVTADDLRELGIATLDEALERVPGLHVSRDSARLNAIYSMRGIHTVENPHVLLLINGIPVVNTVSGGRPPNYRLPVANISRIEIIRGPGSAVYGADAFAGVINVITKEASEMRGGVAGLRAGSFNSQDGWVQYGADHSGWQSAFSLEFSKSDGDDSRIVSPDASGGSASLESRYDVYNLNLDLRHDHWSLWLNSWANRDAGLGAGAARIIDPVGWQDTSVNIMKLRYNDEKLTSDWAVDTYLSYSRMKSDTYFVIYPPGSSKAICSDGGINSGNLYVPGTCGSFNLVTFTDGLIGEPIGIVDEMIYEAAFTYDGFDKHTVRLAVGYKHDDAKTSETKNYGPGVIDGLVSPIDLSYMQSVTGTSYIYMPNSERSVTYLSLQDGWSFAPDWELTGGVRYDDYSEFGDTVNPRLALVWAMDYNLTGKLLYGRAFRAPSFKELYFKNNSLLNGNAGLAPEKLDMVELAFDYRPTFDLTTFLNLFSYRVDDMIQFVNTVAQNSKDQRGHGAELEVIWNVMERVVLEGGFAWQRSEDANSGAVIADAPARQLTLAARYKPFSSLVLSAKAKREMDRRRAATDSRSPVADYTVVDIAARHTIGFTPWEFAAGIKNLFDTDAREPSLLTNDLPLEGRSLHVEASYKF